MLSKGDSDRNKQTITKIAIDATPIVDFRISFKSCLRLILE